MQPDGRYYIKLFFVRCVVGPIRSVFGDCENIPFLLLVKPHLIRILNNNYGLPFVVVFKEEGTFARRASQSLVPWAIITIVMEGPIHPICVLLCWLKVKRNFWLTIRKPEQIAANIIIPKRSKLRCLSRRREEKGTTRQGTGRDGTRWDANRLQGGNYLFPFSELCSVISDRSLFPGPYLNLAELTEW